MVRARLFGQVRAGIRARLLQAAPAFGAALGAVRRLVDSGIGGVAMCSLRAGHVYELHEFVDLQAVSGCKTGQRRPCRQA